MRRAGFLLCMLAALVMAAQVGWAQGRGQIFGQVTRPDGTALSGVEVVLSELAMSRVTGATGTFRFDGVDAGRYNLVFRLGDKSATVTGVEVNAGATTLLEQQVDWEPTMAETFTVFAASRRTQRLVEAPAAVNILTEMDIGPQAVHGLAPKLLEFTLGADLSRSSLHDFNLNARGFSSSLNRRILVLLDGRDPVGSLLAAQEWPAFPFVLDDLASVELVRGPGSALYGANAFNGVLNIASKEPRYSEGGWLRLAGGELSSYRADLRQGGSMGSDWYYKVFGSYETSDGFSLSRNVGVEYPGLPMEPVPLRDLDEERYSAGLRLDKYFDNGYVFTTEVGTAEVEGSVFQTGIGRVQVVNSERPYARLNFNTPRFNAMAYWDVRDAEQFSLSSGQLLYDDSSKWHVELQANTSFAKERGRLVGGVSYREEHVDTAGPGGGQTIISGVRDEDMQAVFGQLEYSFTDKLMTVVAGRWDDSSLHDAQVSPKGALVFSFNANHALRLKYDEAFQTPNYLERFLQIAAAAPVDLSPIESALAPYLGGVPLGFESIPFLALGNQQLEVEEITNYELGYSGILQGRALINLNVYHSELENFVTELLPGVNPAYGPYQPPSVLPPQVQAIIVDTLQTQLSQINPVLFPAMTNAADGSPLFALSYTNFGKAEVDGAEAGLNYFFADAWEISINYSWLDYEVTEALAGETVLPNSPENRLSLGLAYAGTNLDFSIRGRWVDDFIWSAGVFEGEVPSYEVVDVAVRYRFAGGFEFGLYVSNAFDDEHYETFGGDILARRALGHLGYRW